MFPLRIHAGYELQYRRLQVGGFVGVMSKNYQNLVFEILQKIKPDYKGELNYLKDFASPKIQFGGELKVDIGKGISIGATAQTFDATITDTPKGITAGILPENLIYIEGFLSNKPDAVAPAAMLGQTALKSGHSNAFSRSPSAGTECTRAHHRAVKKAPKNITSEKMNQLMAQR